jgi:hypothetical protein
LSEATPSYGFRFFDELRRLTASTFGFSYADILRLQVMGRDEVVDLVAKQSRLSWATQLDATSPEQFAEAIVRESRIRERRQTDIILVEELLAALLSPLFPH